MRNIRMLTLWLLLSLITNVNCSPKDTAKGGVKKKKTPTKPQTVAGETRLPKTWSWQVGISVLQEDKYVFKCGGSLISNDVVMTAAHCLRSPVVTPNQISVTAGDSDMHVAEGTEQTGEVEIIKLHPNYTGTLSSLYSNDIALLKLTKPFTTTPTVSSIKLASSAVTIDYTAPCFIIGWGISATKTSTKATSPLSLLSEAEVRIMTNNECNKKSYWDSLIKPSQICAFDKQVSACLGDSGGPLVCQVNNKYIQFGITSWGTKSCDKRPSVFTYVPYYATWIEQTKVDFNKPAMSSKLTDAFATK